MWCHLPRQRLSRFACIACSVAQSCPTLCNPMNCGLPGSSVHGILQARLLEWIAVSSSRVSSWPMSGWSPCLLHWQVDSLPLSHLGSLDLLAIHYKRLGGCVCVCVCVLVRVETQNEPYEQEAYAACYAVSNKTSNCNLGVSCLLPDPWTVADFYMHRISRLFATLCTEMNSGKCSSSLAKLTTQIQCRGPGREKGEESHKCGKKLAHDISRIKLCQYTLYYSFKWNFTK